MVGSAGGSVGGLRVPTSTANGMSGDSARVMSSRSASLTVAIARWLLMGSPPDSIGHQRSRLRYVSRFRAGEGRADAGRRGPAGVRSAALTSTRPIWTRTTRSAGRC